jgi:hypothetical protein
MFAIDLCKLVSNAYMRRSGTRFDFEKKTAKMGTASLYVEKYRRFDKLLI